MGGARLLQASDAVLWTIERDPLLRSTVFVVGLLDREPERKEVERSLERASRAFPRLRQRVVPSSLPIGPPQWVTDDRLDLDFHLRWTHAPPESGLPEILQLARPIAMAEFDHARPLWELDMVCGVGGGAAFILKFHHSITDGVGAVRIAAALFDVERDATTSESPIAPAPDRTDALHLAATELAEQLRQLGSLVGGAWATTGAVTSDLVRHPVRSTADALSLAEAAVNLVKPAGPPRSPLMTGRSLGLELFTLEVPIDDLRAAGRASGGTLNDAYLAAVVGGIARYHDRHGVVLRELRLNVPVSIRTGDDTSGGNRFVPVRTVVPADIADPGDRMARLGAQVHALRDDPHLGVTDALATVLAELPPQATTAALGSMLLGVDAVVTNVPGSPVPLYFGGALIERLYPFAPLAGAAVNVALLSHLGTCGIGVEVDRAAVPDVEVFRECLAEAFGEIIARGRRAPSPSGAAAPPGAEAPPPWPPTPAHVRQRLSALDAAFLAGESDTTPLHIGALSLYEGAGLRDELGRVRLDDVRRTIASRLDELPQLRWRTVEPLLHVARPVWVEDDAFEIEHHVRLCRLPEPGTDAALRELFADVQMRPVARDRPLWEMWLVDGLADGRVACVTKMHHALVDGVAGAGALAVLLSPEPHDPPCDARPVARGIQGSPSRWSLMADAAREAFLEEPRRWVRDAPNLPTQLSSLRTVLRSMPRAARTSLNQRIGLGRRYETVTVPLEELRAAGRRWGVTVNDLVVAAVTAGLRDLLGSRGESAEHVWALVPRNDRVAGHESEVGNQVTALYASLPVGEPEPARRLAIIHGALLRAKAGPVGSANRVALASADRWPAPVSAAVGRLMHRQPFVNVVITNVAGPSMPLYTLRSQLLELSPYVPLGGNLTVGVAALSYNGQLAMGITADRDACPDVDILVAGIEQEMDTLTGPAAGRQRTPDRTR
jgi:WS/DGAT/MGAT family acyltransferase